jgi:serine/threonine-protein kinase HipA
MSLQTPDIDVVEVKLWGQTMGAVAPLSRRPGYYEFEYDPAFTSTGLQPSPLLVPAVAGSRYSFTGLDRGTFHGLPGLLADSLPDRFGNALINEYLGRKGIEPGAITTLQRLLYVGKRAMGALEFEPAMSNTGHPAVLLPLELAALVADARRAVRGDTENVTQQIIDVGSSAGGARAKAVIGWNRQSRQVVSGQFDLPAGFEHWLLKFDVGEDRTLGHTAGFGRIEYAHYLMARECGIDMSPSELLEENGRAHFMTKRFDREGNDKLHVHSLCGLAHLDFNLPSVHSYEQYLRTVLAMDIGAQALEQAWLRCAYNIAIVNCDDHTKNLAFVLRPSGQWELAPAYDMCFSHNPAPGRWTRQHQMLVGGKAWDIGRGDLLALATELGIKRGRHLLQQVVDIVSDWPRFASAAGVPPADTARIRAIQEASLTLLRGDATGSARAR